MKNCKKKQKRHLVKKSKRNRRFRIVRCHSNPNLRSQKFIQNGIYSKQIIEEQSFVKELEVPENFEILKDTEVVLKFIKLIKNKIIYKKPIDLNFKNVKSIDIGSISVLLSIIEELSINGIRCTGNLPDNEQCRKFIEESGYFNYVKMINNDGNKIEPKNFIIDIGKDTVDSKKIGEYVKKANQKLTNELKTNRNIYTILLEITGNSVEHAYIDKKELSHWFLGINFVNNKYDNKIEKVIFTAVDNGSGILKTIHRKKWIFNDLLISFKNNSNILDGVFNKKYGSRHKQENRNKGLPIIKQRLKENKIKNLKVITNNTFNEYSNKKDTFRYLNNKYDGTFFYFELDLTCYE